MVARVIVSNTSKQVDKFFDYKIPPELEDKVKFGMRVIVPFGRGNNQIEGYVTDIVSDSKTPKLKKILRVVDEFPVFDEKMFELIEYMREKYLCSYIELIHMIVPTGISVKPELWVELRGNCAGIKLSAVKTNILKILSDHKGTLEINRLSQLVGSNVRTHINELEKIGAVCMQYKDTREIADRTVRMAKLTKSTAESLDAAEKFLKKAPLQAKMLEVLAAEEYISISDLVQISGGSYNTVQSLEKKGFLTFETHIVDRNVLYNKQIERSAPPVLTAEQESVLTEISNSQNREFLLHGVTGSGKTEVYMRLIEKVLSEGKSAIMLVPEIALTPQTVARFVSRFGENVAVFHSGLSMGERYDEWKKMRSGKASIAVGARSAVFAPFENIGIIVMDEEHEQSYKSETVPRYHTREVARYRAKQHNALLVMASATPAMESYYEARKGDFTLLTMSHRANRGAMPKTEIVDMRTELEQGNKSIFSRRLKSEIEKNIARGEQTILFLNRRGFSTFVSCRSCGFVAKCPNCNISLTYHSYSDELKCHYCGYTIDNYKICPQCSSEYIRYFGGGTQKVEQEVKRLFPTAGVLRMDVDTTGRKMAHEKILSSFEKNKTDILIGTQMVSKGLDFENVTLVGVISADTMLNIDDFRSSERTFSLLEQVAGRAGRASKPGRAVIQTYNPDNDAIKMMQRHDYVGFYKCEMRMRMAMWYPPFCELVSILITGNGEGIVQQAAKYIRKHLAALDVLEQKVQILGPVPASISKIKNKFRWRIIIKCESADAISPVLTEAVNACYNNKSYERISVVIDKNPNSMY